MYTLLVPSETQVIKLKDGRRLAYIEYGDSKGKPLFFFHGFPGSRFSGRETDTAAQKLGVRVISTDRPGMGLSDFKVGRKLLDWPDDVVELAGHLGIDKFSVLGVSGGGPYAAVCAYKLPGRVNTAGIVVGLAPTHVRSNLEGLPILNRFAWANYHRFPVVRYAGAFGSAMLFRYVPWLSKLVAFPTKMDRRIYQREMKELKQRGEQDSGREAFRQGLRGPSWELNVYSGDWGFGLRDIKTKVYLWYGAKDKCVSLKMGEYYNSQIPNSELFVDQDGGHLARFYFEERILKRLVG